MKRLRAVGWDVMSRAGLARVRRLGAHPAGEPMERRMDDDELPVERMMLTLRALHGGAYTEVVLGGPMATVPRRGELRRLFALLSLWHGGPVDVVLTVARDSANWLDVWSEALGGVPARDARVRFEIARGACAGQSSGNSSGGGGGGRR